MQPVPLHPQSMADSSRWNMVVGTSDFDGAVEVNRSIAVFVVTEGFDGKRKKMRLLLFEHFSHLPLRRAVDPSIGPVRLPTVEVALRFFGTLEAKPFQLPLCVINAAFHLAFAVRIADPTRQGRYAIVREHVAIQGVQPWLVNVGLEHALFQVVEDDDTRRAAETTERLLVKLGPDL